MHLGMEQIQGPPISYLAFPAVPLEHMETDALVSITSGEVFGYEYDK
jgi:hypothetical protein